MAATNYTPIQLYHSTTASAAPAAGNLVNGELAINILDGKLYYKDNGGTVQVIASKGTGTIGGATTQVQYNLSGALAGSSNFTFDGTTATINTLNLTNALGAAYGGTAQSTYAQGDLLYASAANTLAKLPIGISTYILTSNGSIPGWSIPSSVVIGTATNLAGGAAGSVPYQSGAGTTTFLSIGTANQVVTSTGSAPQWSSALTLTGLSNSGLTTLDKTVTVGNTSFNGAAVFAPATPAKVYLGTGTVTDVTSAIAATNAAGAIVALGITPIAATNANVTYTNASTLYIAGAPSAGTNITITNPYSLYVAAGDAYFGGTVTAGTVNLTTLDLTNLEVTNIKAKDGTASMTLADSTGIITLSATAGTANGVAYLNGSRALTTGSALTFDGTNLKVGNATFAPNTNLAGNLLQLKSASGFAYLTMGNGDGANNTGYIGSASGLLTFGSVTDAGVTTEGMRLTSTGLGIGTNNPVSKLTVKTATNENLSVTGGGGDLRLVALNDAVSATVQLSIQGSPLYFRGTGGAINATLDSSGNLGLGVTPSGWGSGFKAIDIGPGSALSNLNSGTDTVLTSNSYRTSTNWVYKNSQEAGYYRQASGTHSWFTAPSGTANTTTITNNVSYTIITSGNQTDFGAANNNVGTVFTANASGTLSSGTVSQNISFTQAMTLDASGNLMLGGTSTTQLDGVFGQIIGSSSKTTAGIALETSAGAYMMYTDSTDALIFWDSGSNVERARISSDGTFRVKGAGTAGSTDAVQFSGSAPASAMTLDASGNLVVGAPSTSVKFEVSVVGTASYSAAAAPTANILLSTTGSSNSRYTSIGIGSRGTSGQNQTNYISSIPEASDGYSSLTFSTYGNYAVAERARITSGGYFKASNDGTYLNAAGTYHEINQTANDNVLFIRSTDTAYSVDGVQLRFSRNTTNNSFYVLSYYNATAAAYKFRVADSGDVTNTNGTYGTISDAKMKTDIVDAGSQWADIKALRFRKFKMKDDPSGLVQLGVVAQEVEQTSPGLVDEHADKDAEGNDLGTTTKSVKTSVLLMKAAVALQEAMARIEKLEAEVAALKGA